LSEPAWKVQERRSASKLGGERNPLSGGASRHTQGDVIHPKLYVECKWASKIALLTLMHDTEAKAKKEKKVPVLALHKKGEKHDYYLVRDDKIIAVATLLQQASGVEAIPAQPSQPPLI